MADTTFLSALLGAVVSNSVFAVIVGAFLHRRSTAIEGEIKLKIDRLSAELSSQRAWKEKALSELLGPVYMQLDRTKRAFERYTARNTFLEAKVIYEGNVAIRDLLLSRGHFIPPELLAHAGQLVEHYDRWLEEFARQRAPANELGAPFVFVGPVGYPFPTEADQAFRDAFSGMWKELYGDRIS